jgi:hypothetical protein
VLHNFVNKLHDSHISRFAIFYLAKKKLDEVQPHHCFENDSYQSDVIFIPGKSDVSSIHGVAQRLNKQ